MDNSGMVGTCKLPWYGGYEPMVQFEVVWYGMEPMVQLGVVWYGMVRIPWYSWGGMVWYGKDPLVKLGSYGVVWYLAHYHVERHDIAYITMVAKAIA